MEIIGLLLENVKDNRSWMYKIIKAKLDNWMVNIEW